MNPEPGIHGGGTAFGKLLFLLLAPLALSPVHGQGETEVFLAELALVRQGIRVSGPRNISRNPGYDNQPSFPEDGTLLYARTRNGQTDIARYSLKDGTTSWLTDTPGGSEYSPLKIPGREAISAIRLDTTGLQRLYAYPVSGGSPSLLLDPLKVGYHLWYAEGLLVCTVLEEDRMDLVVADLHAESHRVVQENVGRSLGRIPDTDQVGFTAVENGSLVVKALDPGSGAIRTITPLPEGVQDVCWLPDGTLVCGSGNTLLGFSPAGDPGWQVLHTFPPLLGEISRIALSPDGKTLALVATMGR